MDNFDAQLGAELDRIDRAQKLQDRIKARAEEIRLELIQTGRYLRRTRFGVNEYSFGDAMGEIDPADFFDEMVDDYLLCVMKTSKENGLPDDDRKDAALRSMQLNKKIHEIAESALERFCAKMAEKEIDG